VAPRGGVNNPTSMPRSRRAWLRAALLLAFCAGGAVRPCAAQAVTAISGSPAAIARIRQEFAAIQREVPKYRRTTHEVVNFSLEGGELTGFFRGGELRKLHARLYGETWSGTEDYYFAGGQPVFVHVVSEIYREPFGEGGGVRGAVEHRYYFDGGRLIRHVRTQRPACEDLSNYDPEAETLLQRARLFAACAASADPEAPECTAPDS
jgi:hypothetical protein